MRCPPAPKGWYWCWLDDSWHHEKIIVKKTMALFCTEEPPDEFCSFAVLRADNEVAELHYKLHDWCVNHVKLDWMTGLSAIEGTEAVIDSALKNGNLSDLKNGPPTLHSLPGKYPEEGDEPR